MPKVDVWPTVHAERAALAADLGSVTTEQWESPSLCEGWTVRETLAHMTATAKVTVPGFFAGIVSSGFSLTKMQAKAIEVEEGTDGTDALARFKEVVNSSKHPPGPNVTWLGEALVHAEDIRRPLGIEYSYPVDAAAAVADSYKGSNLVMGSKRRIEGVSLHATDTDWSHGDGPTVEGPMMSLLLVIAGRGAALDDLDGDGVETLRSRL